MDYAVFGSGSVQMVILPGMSLTSVMPSAREIARQYRAFADDFTVYVFDRRRDFPDDYPVAGMVDDTALAMQTLGISGAYVFGTSQGAMIAMTLAARYPKLVSRLALCSTSPNCSGRCLETMDRWIRLCDAGDAKALGMDFYRRVFSPAFFARFEAALERMVSSGITQEDIRRFRIMSVATEGFDITGELDNISCPAFVAGVEDDTVLGVQGTLDIADQLHCTPFIYPGKGHAVFDEDPGFPERLKAFFTGK